MVVANRHKPLIAQTFGHGGRPTLQLVARSFDFGQGIAEGNFLKQSPGDDAAQPVTVGRTVKRLGQKTADEHLSIELSNQIRLTPTTGLRRSRDVSHRHMPRYEAGASTI